MNSILQHKAPHTVAGMHYSLSRFNELYNWINSLQMDCIAATLLPYQFGLLSFNNPETDFRMEVIGQKLYLYQCCGFTENGSIIGIFEQDTLPLEFDLSKLEKLGKYEVLITVNSHKRRPVGKAANNEIPVRQPFSVPFYDLDIFVEGEKEISSFSHALKVGVLEKNEEKWIKTEYIPTSTHVGASDLLWKKFLKYQETFDALYQAFIHIGQITDIELDIDRFNLRRLVLELGHFLAHQKKTFDLGKKATPFQLFNFCKDFAHSMYFHFYALQRRSQLLDLINHNVHSFVGREFNPQSFRDAIDQLVKAKYNHSNLLESFVVVDRFLNVMYDSVFNLLKQNTSILPLNTIDTEIKPPPSTKKTGSSFF